MVSLIIPFAGQSCRFPGYPPKWRIRHPNGNMMLYESISKLDLSNVSNIYGTFLMEHLKESKEPKELLEFSNQMLPTKVDFFGMTSPTKSQPETVYETIKFFNIKGPIFIKDCDNSFVGKVHPGDYICAMNVGDVPNIDVLSKSYVSTRYDGSILSFVEKQRISNLFCCGGYSFTDAEEYIDAYNICKLKENLYLSNVVELMVACGKEFRVKYVKDFKDWGTKESWEKYLDSISKGL